MSDLQEAKLRIEQLLADGEFDEDKEVMLSEGFSIVDLRDLIEQIYVEEAVQLEFDSSDEGEQQEIIRSFVEGVAFKVALTCIEAVPERVDVTVPVEASAISEIIMRLVGSSAVTVSFTIK